jgi:phasin family protein
MTNNTEQFIATGKANANALEGLASQAYTSVEKLVELNLTASKALLSESFGHVNAVLAAKDPQEFLALQSGVLKPLAEKSVAYFQHVQNILSGSGTEFFKAVEANAAEAQKTFSGIVEDLAKNAPAGAESAVAAFKSALSAGQNAFESARVTTQKAIEAAQSQFTAATTQVAETTRKARQAA